MCARELFNQNKKQEYSGNRRFCVKCERLTLHALARHKYRMLTNFSHRYAAWASVIIRSSDLNDKQTKQKLNDYLHIDLRCATCCCVHGFGCWASRTWWWFFDLQWWRRRLYDQNLFLKKNNRNYEFYPKICIYSEIHSIE